MTILNILYVTVAVILLFGAAVFVHEYGHYWMARRRGLKIEEFAIGFGPKIFSWVRDGVVWSWRWIPAGGFVKLPQMVTSDALEGRASEEAEKLPPASPLSKILVAVAGPAMNVLFGLALAGLLWITGLPVQVNPPIIGHVEPDSPEAKLGIQPGDEILAVDGKPVRSWQEVQEFTILARGTNLPVVIARHGQFTNTYLLTTVVSETLGLKVLNLDPRDHPVIKRVRPGSPAEQAGLREGDEILAFAQVPVFGAEQFIKLVQKCAGETKDLVVRRDGKRVVIPVTPRLDPDAKVARIGAEIGPGRPVYRIEHIPPWTQVGVVIDRTVGTFRALIHSRETGVGLKDLSGPPGIFALLAAYVNTDWRLALSFLVLLNINLAIINMLPIPVLDGGHCLMALIERVARRPLPARLVEYTTTGFALLLISLMIFVSFHDVKRFPLFRSLFKQRVTIEQTEPASAPAPATSP
ncbi:MAG: RIP metalloprotease RseP [Verrucomicrobiae bacterium]|nr:RIP metalloprotease RseP [Verrucomicrobiae bacterium]